MGGSYVLCRWSRVSFNPKSHLKDKDYMTMAKLSLSIKTADE